MYSKVDDARTRKQVKSVVFSNSQCTQEYWNMKKKRYFFNHCKCDMCLGYNINSRDRNNQNQHNLKRVYLTAWCITYSFRVVKTDKNASFRVCFFRRWKYLLRVHIVSPCMSILSTFKSEYHPPPVFWSMSEVSFLPCRWLSYKFGFGCEVVTKRASFMWLLEVVWCWILMGAPFMTAVNVLSQRWWTILFWFYVNEQKILEFKQLI